MRCPTPKQRYDRWLGTHYRLWCRICQGYEPFTVTDDCWIRCGSCNRVLIAAPVIPGMVE